MNLLQRTKLERIEAELQRLIAEINPATQAKLDLSTIRKSLNKVIDEDYRKC